MQKFFTSVVGGLLFIAAAQATPVTYDFAGTLNTRADFTPISTYKLPTYLQPGVAFTGVITFDVAGLPNIATLPNAGWYEGAISVFDISIAGTSWSLLPAVQAPYTYEAVTDNYVSPLSPPGTPPSDGIFLNTIDAFDVFNLRNDPAAVWVGLNGRLPTLDATTLNSFNAVSDLSVFPTADWTLIFSVVEGSLGGKAYSLAQGNLTTLVQRVSVAEPGTAFLTLVAFFGVISIHRGQRFRQR